MTRRYRIVEEQGREKRWVVLGESIVDRTDNDAWVDIARFRTIAEAAHYVEDVRARQLELMAMERGGHER